MNKENFTNEELKVIGISKNDLISDPKKFNILFKNIDSKNKVSKSLGKKIKELSSFKEPVAILGRRNGHWEFYENATQGWFFFEHSDGRKKAIYLDGRPDFMDYADKTFKTYMLHEDVAVKLPEDPITSSEFIIDMEEKMQSDRLKLEANAKSKNIKAMGEILKLVGYFILGLIAIILVARLMGIDTTGLFSFGKVVKSVANETVKNITLTPII